MSNLERGKVTVLTFYDIAFNQSRTVLQVALDSSANANGTF